MRCAAGHEVVEGAFPDLVAPELWAEIIATELLNTLIPRSATMSGRAASTTSTRCSVFYLGPGVQGYLAALAERRALARSVYAWQEEYPFVLAPVFGLPTPSIDFDDFLPWRQRGNSSTGCAV